MEGSPVEGPSATQLAHDLLHDTLEMSLHLVQGTGIVFVPPLAKVLPDQEADFSTQPNRIH